ncbi:MAG: hypothetical protein H6713_41040 [Myxococcales bacterium]|nr:hypothetical protein [Myxococcales bacterium]
MSSSASRRRAHARSGARSSVAGVFAAILGCAPAGAPRQEGPIRAVPAAGEASERDGDARADEGQPEPSAREPSAPGPTPDATPSEPEDAPRGGQLGERQNQAIAGLGTDALQAAFPARVGDWQRVVSRAHPAGRAGAWADSASAEYTRGEGTVDVDISITDMIRVNACAPGAGAAFLEQQLAGGARRVELGARAGAEGAGDGARSLSLMLGDRCLLRLMGSGAPREALRELAAGLELDALERACARRDPRGPLGL